MIDALQYAVMHGKFFSCHVLRIPHGKLRFCMTGKRAFSCLCNTDSRVMPDKHDKLAIFQTQTLLHLIPAVPAGAQCQVEGKSDPRDRAVFVRGHLVDEPTWKAQHVINCKNVWVWKSRGLSCTFCMTRAVCDAGASITAFLRIY